MLNQESSMRLRLLTLLLCGALLAGGEDPFEVPPELPAFAKRHTANYEMTTAKVSALARAFFAPPAEDGLGITYDNSFTRTIKEAWRDRKANCLTLTMLYVAACKSINLDAKYGESLWVSRWRRVGTTIRYERHLVAMVPAGPAFGQDLIADFMPEVRRGHPLVAPLEPKRVRALFHSNRAVELLAEGEDGPAMEEARMSIQVDAGLGVGWNILGVVQRHQGAEAEAEQSFLKAMAADPKDGAPCGNLEDLLKAQGRDQEALVYRDKSMEIRKKDPFFNAFLAEEALQNGQWDEAEKRIKQAIRILREEPDFYLIQARLALVQGRRKEAIRALENARKWAQPEMQPRYDAKLSLLKAQPPS
jgi:tetratricopeptide (TPR) repeat protein